jgi:hypothetical protein
VLLTHTRPAPLLGLLAPLRAAERVAGLGCVSEGGTYDTPGLLFVNRSSWGHGVAAVARLLDLDRARLLDAAERDALDGRRTPHGVIVPSLPPDAAAR